MFDLFISMIEGKKQDQQQSNTERERVWTVVQWPIAQKYIQIINQIISKKSKKSKKIK